MIKMVNICISLSHGFSEQLNETQFHIIVKIIYFKRKRGRFKSWFPKDLVSNEPYDVDGSLNIDKSIQKANTS